MEFRSWVDARLCEELPDGIDPFTKTIPELEFRLCLKTWLNDDYLGKTYRLNIKRNLDSGDILGFKDAANAMPFENKASDGLKFLEETREINKKYGIGDTFAFSGSYVSLEVYKVLLPETISTLLYALLTVVLVVLFITFNL